MVEKDRDALVIMTRTPGWVVLVEHMEKQMEKANNLKSCVNTTSDETIVDSVKRAQQKRDIYQNLLRWVKTETTKKETKNGR